MPNGLHADAISALLTLGRELTHASLTAALVQRAADEVAPLGFEPPLSLTLAPVWHWRLPVSPIVAATGLLPLPMHQLPSQIRTGLPFVPAIACYLDCTSWGEQVLGGLLFLWDSAKAHHVPALVGARGGEHPVLLLRQVYARLLDGRELAVHTAESDAQFHDIFNSVPQGIVVVAAHAQVNEVASSLLKIPVGQVEVEVLGQAMRAARSRCYNSTALDQAYQPLQQSLDAEVVVDWQLDDRIWRVDTHPILRSGYNGRVWLFQDVTAQIKLERMLRREASHDPLTGLFNRRAFFDRAQEYYQTRGPLPVEADGAVPGAQMALLMFDIDHFKKVNDTYGHPVGDQVLKEVARRAQAQLREGDVLARYGGEEFIVLLIHCSSEVARAAAERLRLAMQAKPFQVDGVDIEVRISVGLALRRDEAETLAEVIERADQNLYRAKREGRNRVVDGCGLLPI
ncbi:diguanylate cyclase (GGDEF)-like protein [Acidovorax sp. 56]|uniref:GGDEF domain-containing protein n=1 Tax=Acidovorax sp. 56 TaxID=2035205 RepID=UPI000C60762E|nr:GGDEF domain-containing protein [Acidovorax sp. 56]PIF26654.1 diguanylate cyclase (GGDEF)-like protein [Acidovorax sp. 56]